MIITRQKPIDTIMGYLGRSDAIFIIGCEECAAQCQTGGEKEVNEMKVRLEGAGKKITGTCLVHSLCHELDTMRVLRQKKEELAYTDGVLVLACGAGVQAVSESIDIRTHPGCDSLFLGNIHRHMHFYEKCSTCGDCVLEDYSGICPITRCPKSLLNGPCGGAVNEKCEVDSSKDCIWITIFKKMKRIGNETLLKNIYAPKRNAVRIKPRVEIKNMPMDTRRG